MNFKILLCLVFAFMSLNIYAQTTIYSFEEGEKWYRINVGIGGAGELAISMATSDAPNDWEKLTLLEIHEDYMRVLVPTTHKELKLVYYKPEDGDLLHPAFWVTEKGSNTKKLYRTVEIFGEPKGTIYRYKSYNFYGNGVTEYLYVYTDFKLGVGKERYEVYYATSKNTEKIRLQVKAVNKVTEDMHYILGIDVTFPNDNKIYKLALGAGYAQCLDDTGKSQEYQPIGN